MFGRDLGSEYALFLDKMTMHWEDTVYTARENEEKYMEGRLQRKSKNDISYKRSLHMVLALTQSLKIPKNPLVPRKLLPLEQTITE